MKEDGPCLLLTEGSNDCHVIAALCAYHEIEEGRLGFFNCDNDDGVLKKANALLMLDGEDKKEAVGLVLDADASLAGRWESIRSKLSKYGYTFSDSPEENGTILSCEGLPVLGIWIMPNNIDVGMLEDFCANLISSKSLKFAKEAVSKVEGTIAASFKDVHRSKAEIHTYLAWQDEPGRPLGQSITARVLQPDAKIATVFADWLNRLFPTN